ncbi:MAG: hypothetical protein ABJB69_01160 [Spartobacteria bacterium]
MRLSILATPAAIASLLLANLAKAGPVLEETLEKNFPVEPQATLSIQNTDGSIRIYGSDSKEVKVQAIKRSYRAERLKEIAINISAEPGKISIETQYPPKTKWGLSDRSGTVDYIILLPWSCEVTRADLANGELLVEGMRGGKVRASLGSGRLFSHNCFSDLDINVGNGAMDIGYDWWEERKFSVSAQITNGNTRAFFPGDAAFHLIAESVNGNVASDFTEKENRQSGGVSKIDMLIGKAKQIDVKLQAVNGSIKITEAGP